MKKIILLATVLMNFNAFAQKIDETKVPAAVKNTFKANFPMATDVKWENEKGNYEANFTMKSNKMAALFNAEGAWLETERTIDINKLPKAALEYVQKNYKDKIQDAAEIKKANEVNYEVEIKGSDLIFDAQGKYIKTVKD